MPHLKDSELRQLRDLLGDTTNPIDGVAVIKEFKDFVLRLVNAFLHLSPDKYPVLLFGISLAKDLNSLLLSVQKLESPAEPKGLKETEEITRLLSGE